ncbi:MAG: response regulator [Firmicutes bacterium]|nr:response regulator [Bacillota bacterium]
MLKSINVLIVEDDPMVMDIHKRFISSIEGFKIAGEAFKGSDALKIMEHKEVDLVILDIFMPELDGIETLKKIRENGDDVDVILITAASEGNIIKEVVRFGAFDYIIKPFKFERFKSALDSYKRVFEKMNCGSCEFSQEDIDNVFIPKSKKSMHNPLPKGLQTATLKNIVGYLKNSRVPLSADEVAGLSGVSRVTARRYLEYLIASGRAVVEPCYREVGRPVNKYRLME